METKEKTVKQLYDEFCEKYTVDQVSHDKELSMIYAYLQYQCSMANGNYTHIPGPAMQGMIEKHLEYEYEKSPAMLTELFKSNTTLPELRCKGTTKGNSKSSNKIKTY